MISETLHTMMSVFGIILMTAGSIAGLMGVWHLLTMIYDYFDDIIWTYKQNRKSRI